MERKWSQGGRGSRPPLLLLSAGVGLLLLGFFLGALFPFGPGKGESSRRRGSPPVDSPDAPSQNAESSGFSFFGSGEAGEIDYERLARVCLQASQRGAGSSGRGQQGEAGPSGAGFSRQQRAPAQGDALVRRVDALARVLSLARDEGTWTKRMGDHALRILRALPADEAAAFESELASALESGEIAAEPNAWVPRDEKMMVQ